jgi:hypothetical protein
MIRKFRKLLKNPLRKLEFAIKSNVSNILRSLFLKRSAPISVSFDSLSSTDGTGAQLQRQIAVIALAKYFGFHYIHSQIQQVSVHPLDPFQSDAEYKTYLERLNRFLDVSSYPQPLREHHQAVLSRITLRFLLKELVLQRLRPRDRHFVIHEPYPITEFCPGILDNFDLNSSESPPEDSSHGVYKIVLHYRQGVGGFAIYPGQNIPREIPLEVFCQRIEKIIKKLPSDSTVQIIVLTDAPEGVTEFRPPADQVHLWEGSPGFANGVMKIQPIDFHQLNRFTKTPIVISRGGNPLDAILTMAAADALLIGKSSLSFVGALLNHKGNVYYPKDFWHKPLQNWQIL